MLRRRTLIVVSGLAALAALTVSSALAREARPAPTSRVLCSDAIHAGPGSDSYTVILGRVGLQTSRTLQAVRLPGDPFPWWAKSGLEVASGSPPVVISVPPAWRSRVAIGWNNRGGVEAAVEHVDACSASAWLAYPGGFHVMAKGCVPVDVRVGSRQQRVYVAVGSRAGCARRQAPASTPSAGHVEEARVIAQWRAALTRGAREDPTRRFPNPSRATFRKRLAASAARYGFHVVRVEILHPRQDAPLVAVQPMSKSALAASTRAILSRLDPSVRAASGGVRRYAYEGFLFEAVDARGEPYVIEWSTGRRPNVGGGIWAGAGDFVPVPSAFPLR